MSFYQSWNAGQSGEAPVEVLRPEVSARGILRDSSFDIF
jgi:hypothetical protein